MPDANQIEIDIRADTTQARAAVNEFSQDVQRLKRELTPGATGSGILTPLPAGLGGAPSTLLERATAAAKANAEAAAKAGTAMKNYGLDLEEVGTKAGRAGINIGNLMERIAVRLVIFEALRLAIQGVKYAIDQISNLQQAELAFDALNQGLDQLGARFEHIREQSSAALIPPEKGTQIVSILQDYGASADQASMYVKDLGQWSKILGVDAGTLAEALGRVAEGEGSLKDMRLVTQMMGDQAAAGRQLVQTLVDLQKEQKNLESSSVMINRAMETVTRGMERGFEEGERHLERHQRFTEKIITAQVEWDRARGREIRTPTQVMTQAFEQSTRGAGVPGGDIMLQPIGGFRGPRIPKAELAEYQAGIAAIAREQQISQRSVHVLIRQQVLDYHDVLEAARQARQDQLRNIRDTDEARKVSMENQKLNVAGAITTAKAAIATGIPQAVTAPPTELWNRWTGSIAGQQATLKESFDQGIAQLLKALETVGTNSGDSAKNTEDLYKLLSSGT